MQTSAYASRIRLDTISVDDQPFYISLYTDADVMRYIRPVCSADEALELFHERSTSWQYGDAGWLGFTLKLVATEQRLGTIGLKVIDYQAKIAEVGFILHPDAQGCGYIAEALLQLKGYAIDKLKLQQWVACCAKDNAGSAKVLQRSGFIEVHHVNNNLSSNAEQLDDRHFKLLLQ